MLEPEMPDDESERLKTLRSANVLDTLPEERFDRLTRMARRMFHVPIALVSLVDENRQWFKSCIGLNATETSRDISFCGHTILDDEVLVINDASRDERFADNPLVTGDPNIRFYAGCPLVLNGYRLGTLCIIDQIPRGFQKEDIADLKDLATMVERELEAVQLATLDELTGISNRRGFKVLSEHSLSLCLRQTIPATLVFLDLDEFKPINDLYGHAEGDRALVAFANQMKQTFRHSDLFARIGGDEFVVLLTNTSKDEAEEIVHRFGQALDDYNKQAKRGYDVAFSYGIVEYRSGKHHSVEDLLNDGDNLMYQVKESKK